MTPQDVYALVRNFIAQARAAGRAANGVGSSRVGRDDGRSSIAGLGADVCDDPRDCPPQYAEQLLIDEMPRVPNEPFQPGGSFETNPNPFRPGGGAPVPLPIPGFRPVPPVLSQHAANVFETALPPSTPQGWYDNFGNSLLEPYWTTHLGGFGELTVKAIRSTAAPSCIGSGNFLNGEVETTLSGSIGVGPVYRAFMSGGLFNGYHVAYTSSGGGNLLLRYFTAGTPTTLLTVPGVVGANDRIGAIFNGTSHDVTHNGAIVGSFAHFIAPAAGFAGVYANLASAQIADFRATPA